jgi:ADP-heptose:LPS heptosyltransferase
MVGKTIGAEVKELTSSPIPISKEEKNFTERILADKKITEEHFLLGVNINASELAFCRRWPKEKFAQVINILSRENKSLKIILIGSKGEKKYTSSIFQLLEEDVKNNIFDLSGSLNFGQFIALLSKLHLLLTNDSGPFHLAKAQGIPTISIWGPGSPDLYGPYQDEKNKHRVIYKRWPCSPCMYIYRTDAGYFCNTTTPCLHGIHSQEVAMTVKEHLNELTRNKKR